MSEPAWRQGRRLEVGQLAFVQARPSRSVAIRSRAGGERRQADPFAGLPRPAGRPVDGGPAGAPGAELPLEHRGARLDRPAERLVGREAVLGQLDRRSQERARGSRPNRS